MKREVFQMPDPMKPYGSNPVTMESIRVRESHALADERERYAKALRSVHAEHEDAERRIKAAFDKDRTDLIAANWTARERAA